MVCLNAFVGRIADELSTCFALAPSALRARSAGARHPAQQPNDGAGAAALPGRAWVAEHAVKVMLQYPSGLSYCVLLTELENKWRMLLRRGEHAGKLRQVLASDQVLDGDILCGALAVVNFKSSDRFVFVDSATSVDLIMHSQFDDIMGFFRHYGMPFFVVTSTGEHASGDSMDPAAATDRSPVLLSCLGCRLVRAGLARPALLCTRLALFELIVPRAREIFEGPILGTHKYFMSQYPLWVNKPPEEQGVMGVIALVRQVSRVLDAPHVPRGLAPPAESKGGGGRRPRPRSCNSYSTVLLELVRLDEPRPSHASDMECVAPWLIYLVLVDEEVELASDISVDDLLYIYRPWVASNCDDPAVFGGIASSAHGSGGAALPSEVGIPRASHLISGAGGEAMDHPGVEAGRGGDLMRHFGGLTRGFRGSGGPRASDGIGSHLSYGAVTAIVKLKDAVDLLGRANIIPSTLMPARNFDSVTSGNRNDSQGVAPKDLEMWASDRTMFGRVQSIIQDTTSCGVDNGGPAWSPGMRRGRETGAHRPVANDVVVVCQVPIDVLELSVLAKFDVNAIIVALGCKHGDLPCASNGRGDALLEGNLVLMSRVRVDKIKVRRIGAKRALVMLACLCNASKWRQSPSVVSALDTIISKCTTAAGDPDEAGDRGASELDQQVSIKRARLEATSGFYSGFEDDSVVFEAAVPDIDSSIISAIYNVSSVAALVNSPSLISQASPALLGSGCSTRGSGSPSELILVQRGTIEEVRTRMCGSAAEDDLSDQTNFRYNLEIRLLDTTCGRAFWCRLSPSCVASAHIESLCSPPVAPSAPLLLAASHPEATRPALNIAGQCVTCALSPCIDEGGRIENKCEYSIDVITEHRSFI